MIPRVKIPAEGAKCGKFPADMKAESNRRIDAVSFAAATSFRCCTVQIAFRAQNAAWNAIAGQGQVQGGEVRADGQRAIAEQDPVGLAGQLRCHHGDGVWPNVIRFRTPAHSSTILTVPYCAFPLTVPCVCTLHTSQNKIYIGIERYNITKLKLYGTPHHHTPPHHPSQLPCPIAAAI